MSEPHMPVEVARTLLSLQRTLSLQDWQALKAAYHRARQSYAPVLALDIAQEAFLQCKTLK